MDERQVAERLVRLAKELTARITKGKRYGDWAVTSYVPLTYDDFGAPEGGVIKLVNQNTTETVLIQHDHALKAPEWWASFGNRHYSEKSPERVIEKVVKRSERSARELSAASVKWTERDDSKGHRWTAILGEYGGHVVEIEGPGQPLYRIMLAMPDGEALKFKRQLKTIAEAKKVVNSTLKALADERAAGVDLTKQWKVAKELVGASERTAADKVILDDESLIPSLKAMEADITKAWGMAKGLEAQLESASQSVPPDDRIQSSNLRQSMQVSKVMWELLKALKAWQRVARNQVRKYG